MADYRSVTDALASGADPSMLCMTCPWDRFCITPPSMTAEEVRRSLDDAKRKDEEAAEAAKAKGESAGRPVGMLISTIVVAGRDTQAQVCPVFALRLRSADGGTLVAGIRKSMQEAQA